MRTKTSKESKRVPENDVKINLSVPKVVLDASDCAKFLDGTGKTSVILVEKGGKMVPASSSSSLSPPSSLNSASVSIPASFSSSPSLSKSQDPESLPNSIEAIPLKSHNLSHDTPASTSQISTLKSPTQSSIQIKNPDQNDFSVSLVQDSVPSEQSKMILKPPKKRRGNDKGAYDESATNSLVNGRNSLNVITPMQSVPPHVTDAEEAVALRSTPSFPIIPSPSSSNSLQKHTIENLLQTSPSLSNNNNNNNNNNNSSNMNLISGTHNHQTYNSISHPLHTTSAHELCSGTTTVSLPALPSSSSSTTLSASLSTISPLPLPLSSASLSFSTLGSNVLHKNLMDSSMPHSDMDSTPVYSNPTQVLPSQATLNHSHITPILTSGSVTVTSNHLSPSTVPALSSPLILQSSSSPSHPPSPPTNKCQVSFHGPPIQDEPINLSKSSKMADISEITHPSKPLFEDCKMEVDDQTVSDSPLSASHKLMDVNGPTMPEGAKVTSIIPSDVWKQNSDLSYSEISGMPHQKNEKSSLHEKLDVDVSSDTRESESKYAKDSILTSNLNDDFSGNLKSDALKSTNLPTDYQDVKMNSEEGSLKNEVSGEKSDSHTANITNEDEDMAGSVQSSFSKQNSEHCLTSLEGEIKLPASPLVSQNTVHKGETSSVAKPKKSGKKRDQIPMDDESCAKRSTIYAESIDDVIQNFEFVSNPHDDINLTEEEEAILRQQFDDSGSVEKHDQDCDLKEANISLNQHDSNGGSHEGRVGSHNISEDASSKATSKSHKKGKSKKQLKEKLSPVMQNVVDVLSIVAADISNTASPTESGLSDLEVLLRSLNSRCQKKISQLSEVCESNENPDTKTALIVKKAKKNISDISLFYPSDDIDESDQANQSELLGKKSTNEVGLDNSQSDIKMQNVTEGEKPKLKKAKKRKSSELKETKNDTGSETVSAHSDTSKPKKIKKSKDSTKQSLKSHKGLDKFATVRDNQVVATQTSEECSFMSVSKMDTSDIGESIASGGSDQMTPVHEPDVKDEAVNTDHQMDQENNDTGLESCTDDKESKPVRHYKKRLDFVKCPHCDHQSRGRSALSRHMKKIHLLEADMPYKCHLCTYGCTKMASLNRHLFTHSVFPCSRCDFTTDERDKLTEHMAEQHKDKLDMKLCKKCNRYIKCESFTIEEHTDKCDGPIPYKCTECSKEFKYASSLKVHYHTHFPDEPKRFKCELCDYRTNYKANLHKHNKNMHASRDRDVQCPDCGKLFSTEDNMRRHRKVHTLVRPFACETCKKTFKTSGALKGHQLIHTATRAFTCSIPGCNRSFRTPKFLKSHQEEYHRLVPKKFFCQVEGCNYSFFKRSHLKRHAITHTGERNYHCKWPGCSKSFRHADNLKVHFRGHTNDKPVQCHLCDFKCKQRNALFWHKKKVHQVIDASAFGSSKQGADSGNKKHKNNVMVLKYDIDTGDEYMQEDKKDSGEGNNEIKPRQHQEDKVPHVSDEAVRQDENSTISTKNSVSEITDQISKASGGSMDLYEFKSDDESEGEGSSPLKWENVKSIPAPPLPPPPKELLLKNERLLKKERDKVEKAEQKELLKKEKADKKEQEKKERAEKKELEKKERAEKKEQEKKEREEKKEQEKKDKLEQKEKEKKEREELKEKEKKEKEEQKEQEKKTKEEQKEQERKTKEEQKEKEKKEKEEQKEKERLEKLELKEKEKQEKEAMKEKAKKDKERKKLEVKRLKEEAKKILQKRSNRTARGVLKKNCSVTSLKSSSAVKGKKSLAVIRRKSPSRAASQKDTVVKTKPFRGSNSKPVKSVDSKPAKGGDGKLVKGGDSKPAKGGDSKPAKGGDSKPVKSVDGKLVKRVDGKQVKSVDDKPVRGRKKAKSSTDEMLGNKGKVDGAKKRKAQSIKSPAGDSNDKSPSRVSSLRAASPRGTTNNKSPASENKPVPSKGKKKATLPKRKPSARIKANLKTQVKKKRSPGALKKTIKSALKKKKCGGKREKSVKKDEADASGSKDDDCDGDEEGEGEIDKDKIEKIADDKAEKTEEIAEISQEQSEEQGMKENASVDKKCALRPPSPSSSEEDMLQGNASPYRDFSDAENMEKEEEDEAERAQSSSDSLVSEEACKSNPNSASPKELQEQENNPSDDGKMEEDNTIENENSEAFAGEESSDDEGINDIPLTPPRAPAPPPMESSEDEMEPDTMDSSAPYSTPAPNTPYSTPAPNTPFSVPGPNTPFSVPPPTNLMQQHSVHSEEMATGVSSVASLDMPSNGSVEMQQPQGSVESHSVGSVEMHHRSSNDMHPHGSVEMHHRSSTEMHQHNSEMHHRSSTEMHPHGSVEMHPHSSVEMHPHSSVEMHPHGSVEMHPHSSVEMHPHGSVEMHPHGSVEMHPHGSVEMHPHGSVEMHPHGSVEMHPHGSVEMHPHGSVEMHPHGSVEMHPHGSVEMHSRNSTEMHPHGSEIHHRNSTEMHPHGSVEMHPQGSVEMTQQGSVEMLHHTAADMHRHASVDMPAHGQIEGPENSAEMRSHSNMEMHSHNPPEIQPHGPLKRSQSLAQGDIHQLPQPLSQTETSIPNELPSTPSDMTGNTSLHSHDKFNMPTVLEDNEGNNSEADKRYFDQYLKTLSAHNNSQAASNLSGVSEPRDMMNKSPNNLLPSAVPTSVITSMDNPSGLFHGQADLRRLEAMVGERHHHDSLYARDTMSALSRVPDRQSTATPLVPVSHATPAPTFDPFPSLNPLHSSTTTPRENPSASYFRQQENIFASPPVTSSFMAEAMFQRQSMTTPFLPPPPQAADRNSLSRISDPTASLRTNNASTLLRRPSTMPGAEMFTTPAVPQAVSRHPLTNAWSGQEVRPTHWQNPYLPRQPNMTATSNPFFPAKENYLPGREFMFDPSAVRSPTERGMFSSLTPSQSQDSLQFDRFDLSNFFPSAVTPYGSAASSLDYTRNSHSAAPKTFDERYRQTAAAASAAALPDFRGLPPTSASTDRFPGIGVNSGFNLYPSNHPMPYHPQHMTDNMNSAFLTHPSTAQHAMLERDYAAAAAHRGLYPHPHQNTPYPFIDERQYSGSSKLSHTHTTPTTVTQERDLMSRSVTQDSQMQDPYRSMLYRY